MNTNGPFDPKSAFYQSYFSKALPYAEYLASAQPHEKQKWDNFYNQIKLSEAQSKTLSPYTRKMPVLVLSGTWCGDCARQCPILAKISETSKNIDLRFIDNQTYPELRDAFRVCGGARVPVAVFFTEDFYEVARYGDRTLSTYRRKFIQETGAACDSGIGKSENVEVQEWLDVFERAALILETSGYLRARYQ